MFWSHITGLPTQLMLFAAGTTTEFPNLVFWIDGSVLPMAIAAEHDGPVDHSDRSPQFRSFIIKDFIGVIVSLIVPIWADNRCWAKHQFELCSRLA